MKNKNIFLLSVVSFLISALSAAILTIANRDIASTLSNILATLFWLSMIFGFIMCGILARKTCPKEKRFPRPLHIFRTKPLVILDTIFFLSLIGMVLCVALHSGISFFWVILFLNIFTFEIHILLSISNKENFT